MKKICPNSNLIRSEEGFSLVEILVAITITTILIGFAFGIYLFGQRYFIRWQAGLNLQNELHTLANGISEEIFRSDQIISLEQHKIVLRQSTQNKQQYEMRDDSLFKNTQSLLRSSLSLVAFELSAQGKKGQLLTGPALENIGDIAHIEFSLALTDGRDSLGTTRRIYLRKPSNWNPLN